MHSHVRTRRRAVGLTAVVLAALAGGTLLNASAAIGAPDDYGNIDPDAPASITIHKHEYQTASPAPEGAPDGSVGVTSDPIAGVVFTAYPILGIDLSESRDWDELASLTPGPGVCAAPAGYQLGTGIVGAPTAADGTAKIDVPVGAFLVCETDAPASVVERAQPFIVTAPLPYQDGWLYGIHVYPKNGTAGITKTIEAQEGLGLGSSIRFPVTTDVPVLGEEKLISYVVSDTLDPRLSPDPDAGSGSGVASVRVEGGAAVDPSYFDVVVDGQSVRVVFTAAGLTWLEGQDGIRLVTTFQGVITSVGDGAITNEALLFINDPDLEKPTGVSPTVTSYWGDARILKTDDADAKNPLAGAIFEVYAATAPYATDCSAAVATGAALSVGGTTRFTSTAAGVVSIAGLFVSDSVNTPVSATQRCYVIREVQAPSGFVTPVGPAADTGIRITVGTTATGTYQAEIRNAQQNVPNLPLTGANGQLAMTIAGGALVLIAVGAVLVSRRRARTTL
ncbi:SpaH/EbpB family LPXTG-anchored major pilin [Streptomyces sp. AC495_CC817]|uniref:SpaH/EbpB family LPXTG-anchored major pilin n=1 Tax=Streptomyces sp. AC495_CC817 TaxID=2823900 RepID=UPI001C276DF0|nr:SpaH/EbpB family LPXTG-anchored major pilin [Streptomyces sp. AC495_CC817]